VTPRLYRNDHRYQYDRRNSVRTRSSGCTWISGADGADAATGGRRDVTPDHVLGLVLPREETSPATPGWSLPDLDLAMRRLGVGFEDMTGAGWSAVLRVLDARHYVVLQGDSEVFTSGCSGAFDGDHAIGLHPDREPGTGRQRIDDPICRTARFESRTTLRTYAEKLHRSIRFGLFTDPVPNIEEDTHMDELTGTGGELRRMPAGTEYFDEPDGARVGVLDGPAADLVVYRVLAYHQRGAVRWALIDGGSEGPLRWVVIPA
jgi:hypothetical protein